MPPSVKQKKSPWKKSFRKKSKNFTLKSSVGKSPFIKKSPKKSPIKSGHKVLGLFFWLLCDFIQKSPLTSENAMEKSPGCKHPINNRRFIGAIFIQ